MLICKTLHKGYFIKEIFKGNFTSIEDNIENNMEKNIIKLNQSIAKDQILVVTDRSLELYDYIFDDNLKIPFLEPKFNQEMFMNILDCKVMNLDLDTSNVLVVLLTSCGLLIFKYSNLKKSFEIKCSELLNINSEERDKFMYLKTDEKYGLIVIYSNTNKIFIYRYLDDCKLILLNDLGHTTSSNIIEVIVTGKRKDCGKFDMEENLLFSVEAIMRKGNYYACDSFKFDENYQTTNTLKVFNNNTQEFYNLFEITCALLNKYSFSNHILKEFYRFIVSPFNNFIFLIAENGYSIIESYREPREFIYTKIFNKVNDKINVLSSFVIFDNFIQLNFDKKSYIFEEDIHKKEIKKVKCLEDDNLKTLNSKKILRISEGSKNSYNFIYYDHKMNLIFTEYELKPDKDRLNFIIKIKNEFSDNSFYSLDSSMIIKTSNETSLYSLCGFKGSSKLIKFEKAMIETKFNSVEYMPIICVNFIKNSSNEIFLFLSTSEGTKLIKFSNDFKFTTNTNMQLGDINLNDKTINIKQFDNEGGNIYAHIISKSLRIYNKDFTLRSLIDFNESVILFGQSFVYLGKIYFCIYLNNGFFAIYSNHNNSFKEECLFKFPFNVSSFDFILQNELNRLFLVICTYDNRIDIYKYDLSNNEFKYSSLLNLTNNEKTEIIPECVKIFNNFVCISTRTGEFCIFYLNKNQGEISIQELIYSYAVPGEKDVLYISDIIYSDKNTYIINLHNRLQVFMLEVKVDEMKNIKINRFKYLLKDEFSDSFKKNRINFFKNFTIFNGLNLTIYQNRDIIYLSNFSKPMNNTLTCDLINKFLSNQLARRVITYDQLSLIVLIETYEGNSNFPAFNSLYAYSTDNLINSDITNALYNMAEERIKINSMKLFNLSYELNTGDRVTVKYLGLCGHYQLNNSQHDSEDKIGKGFLHVLECIENEIGILKEFKLIKKLNLGQPSAFDFCHIRDHLIVSCENDLLAIKLEFDNINRKLAFNASERMSMINRIISLNSIKDSYSFILGDSKESISLMEFDPRKHKFETIGMDLALRTVYKAIPDGDESNSVILLQKTGVFSKFSLNHDTYELMYSYDTREFINRCHIIKPYYLCTTIIGSLVSFFEISNENLMSNYMITSEDLISFQNLLVKKYSKKIFNKELSLEILRNMSEPIKNVLIVDLFETLVKTGLIEITELKNITKFEKIIEFINYFSELSDNII